MMPSFVEKKEDRRRKKHEPIRSRETAASQKEPVQSQPLPLPPCDDIQARIADRAYELYAQRGYREGYALEDWLEAEREILGLESKA